MRIKLDHATGKHFFYCPGCNCNHYINILEPREDGTQWLWNGDMNAPTIRPSIVRKTGILADPSWKGGLDGELCESRITDGQIQFRATSTHHLGGYCVPLPELP